MFLPLGLEETVEIRLEATTAAAASIDADVICLQEIWRFEEVEYVSSQLKEKFVDVYFNYVQIENDGDAACSPDELEPL